MFRTKFLKWRYLTSRKYAKLKTIPESVIYWHKPEKHGNIQIDSDEYCLKVLLILKQNKHYLNNPEQQPVEIQCGSRFSKK
jgi:hypothetical protein